MEKENKPLIYEAICKVAEDVGAIGKSDYNQQQKFRYRGIDMVMNALHPAFVKHGIFVVPNVKDIQREQRMTKSGGNLTYTIATIEYTFYAKDGTNIKVTVVGEGMDSADKSTNKAMSVAFKYACFQVFCIPTEEMKDPDADSYEVMPQNAPPQQYQYNNNYNQYPPNQYYSNPNVTQSQPPQLTSQKVVCPKCKREIKAIKKMDGSISSPQQVLDGCGGMCYNCFQQAKRSTTKDITGNED